jgi:topoisomerase IV subunit B
MNFVGVPMSQEPLNTGYDEDSIKSLEWNEHIRRRPGMYIGKLGDGSAPDDGIYILFKEIVDNSIDEFVMGAGKEIRINVTDEKVAIRDYGRGIPLGKLVDCVSKINTGGKYDSGAFQKSVGLNGVGTKAANALSKDFKVTSWRESKAYSAEFKGGELIKEGPVEGQTRNGTEVEFYPDDTIFKNYRFRVEYLEERVMNYAFLNRGLRIKMNGKIHESKNGLLDLLSRHVDDTIRYPIVHLGSGDIELAFTHGSQYGEHYYTFVNGQHTTEGGTHQQAFRESFVKTIREFFKKNYEASDIRASIIASISVRIQEPVFESQTKNKLGSLEIDAEGTKLKPWINDFIKTEVDNYLHRNTDVANALLKRIQQSEKERKDIAGVRKLANERAKKASVHNKKLRDCKIHFDTKKERRLETSLFITEGDSASGSLTKARDVQTQAVFSLKGKPLNTFGLTKKVVYENEEFNLLQHALHIEDGLEGLKFNRVILATDADVDGMHIRLLMLTFFLQFFPELVENGHLYILQTPLFRVRDKKKTVYCYSDEEKNVALVQLNKGAEITRFKGLGEISPSEFGQFISEDKIRLDPVVLQGNSGLKGILEYYMGRNTPDRQKFIVDHLKMETVAN